MTLEPQPVQLISYIALSAPATRRPAVGNEPFLRPEIGFTPKWFHTHVEVNLGRRWHTDPAYRRDTIITMAKEIRNRFGDQRIGALQDPDHPQDLLTGTFGTSFVAGIYGIPCVYQCDNWPWSEHQYISEEEADNLESPDLDNNSWFAELMDQLDWIAGENGRIEGYVNWQGVLNNAYRLRGQSLFIDMLTAPERSRRIFDCVTCTMVEAARRVYERQRRSGVERHLFTVSNCLVNMVSPDQYREFLLPCDQWIAESFGSIGVHNCAWNANPYMNEYAKIADLSYIDMGIESDLSRAREAFQTARRALMYTPMNVAERSSEQIRSDFEKIAAEYGPCDIVFADIEAGTPDERVLELIRFCDEISQQVDQ